MFYRIEQFPGELMMIVTLERDLTTYETIRLYQQTTPPESFARIVDLIGAPYTYPSIVRTLREMRKGDLNFHAPIIYLGTDIMRPFFDQLKPIGIPFFTRLDAAFAYSRVHSLVYSRS